jgi:fido (protein-threonine AMPylation protein)
VSVRWFLVRQWPPAAAASISTAPREAQAAPNLAKHRVLFDAIYPWAGQDRTQTAPDIAVSKDVVLFAHPNDIRPAVDYALTHGQDKAFMASKPGEVMGYLAHGHPFLDGNGRTIMVVHSVLAQRAGFSIDWAKTDKTDYLLALTKELDAPGKGILDGYLKPFMGEASARASPPYSSFSPYACSLPLAPSSLNGRNLPVMPSWTRSPHLFRMFVEPSQHPHDLSLLGLNDRRGEFVILGILAVLKLDAGH